MSNEALQHNLFKDKPTVLELLPNDTCYIVLCTDNDGTLENYMVETDKAEVSHEKLLREANIQYAGSCEELVGVMPSRWYADLTYHTFTLDKHPLLYKDTPLEQAWKNLENADCDFDYERFQELWDALTDITDFAYATEEFNLLWIYHFAELDNEEQDEIMAELGITKEELIFNWDYDIDAERETGE